MKKKNILNFIYGGILIVVIVFVVPPFVNLFKSYNCTYKPTLKNEGRFYYLFKDKTAKNYNRIYSAGRSNKGWIYSYLYKKKLRITIWELLNINHLEVNNFVLKKEYENCSLKNNSYSYSDIGPDPVIRLAQLNCLNLTDKVYINLLGKEDYIDTLRNSHIMEFMGKVKEIDLVNKKNECQMRLYSLKNSVLTDIIIVKNKKNILFIFINPVGENSFKSNPFELFIF